jgi:hypothetical protein
MSFKEKTSVYKIIILYYARKWSIYRSFIENTSVPLEEKPLLNAPKFLFHFQISMALTSSQQILLPRLFHVRHKDAKLFIGM